MTTHLPLTLVLTCLIASPAAAQLFPTTDGGVTTTDPDHWNFCGNDGNIEAGPQSPRDIDRLRGANVTRFAPALPSHRMNLCNVHFHWNAEHKSAAFSTFVDTGDQSSGWAIVAPASVDPDYRAEHDIGHLLGDPAHEVGVIVGDTIEVHWVHTSCAVRYEDLDPANGLANCLTQFCANPQLRVVTQVFKIVDDDADVESLDTPMRSRGPRVVYSGSTTGPSYNNEHCSPLQVTWDVKKRVATIDAVAVAQWAQATGEHAHGVRELVTRTELLSRAKVRRGGWR